MATVTVLNEAAIHALVDAALNSAVIDVSGHLVFTTVDGTTIDLGNVLDGIPSATESVPGLITLASDAEALAGTNTTKATTAHGVAGAIAALSATVTTSLAAKAPTNTPTFTGTVTLSGRQVITPDAITLASGHAAIDASVGNVFDISATANFTLDNPTNPVNGQVIHLRITQDATGGRTITLGTAWNAGPNTITLSTGANKRDHLVAQYHSGSSKWDITGFQAGF